MIDSGPLAGFTIGVTSVRRWHEFGAALEQRGARVVYAPAIRIVDPIEDSALLEATVRGIARPPDIVIITTAIGFRSWLDAAQVWGIADSLRERIGAAELIARGPRSRAAVRAAGFAHGWSPDTDSATEVLEHLLHRDLTGQRILVQTHGGGSRDLLEALAHVGADVHELTTYGWVDPVDVEPLEQFVLALADGHADAVAFTTAAAVQSVLHVAQRLGHSEAVLAALRGRVVAACIGPVTAAPLTRLDIPVAMPARPRLGSLVREIVDTVARRAATVVQVVDHRIEVRGHAVVVDGLAHLPGPDAMLVAKRLVAHPGAVSSRAELAALLGPDADVDAAISALAAALADSRALQVISTFGYRLAYEPGHSGGCGHDLD
jgi:uroporphyrinogen-III synthase